MNESSTCSRRFYKTAVTQRFPRSKPQFIVSSAPTYQNSNTKKAGLLLVFFRWIPPKSVPSAVVLTPIQLFMRSILPAFWTQTILQSAITNNGTFRLKTLSWAIWAVSMRTAILNSKISKSSTTWSTTSRHTWSVSSRTTSSSMTSMSSWSARISARQRARCAFPSCASFTKSTRKSFPTLSAYQKANTCSEISKESKDWSMSSSIWCRRMVGRRPLVQWEQQTLTEKKRPRSCIVRTNCFPRASLTAFWIRKIAPRWLKMIGLVRG